MLILLDNILDVTSFFLLFIAEQAQYHPYLISQIILSISISSLSSFLFIYILYSITLYNLQLCHFTHYHYIKYIYFIHHYYSYYLLNPIHNHNIITTYLYTPSLNNLFYHYFSFETIFNLFKFPFFL
jgi:hypothetical protein